MKTITDAQREELREATGFIAQGKDLDKLLEAIKGYKGTLPGGAPALSAAIDLVQGYVDNYVE